MLPQSPVFIYPLLFYWGALFSSNVSIMPWNCNNTLPPPTPPSTRLRMCSILVVIVITLSPLNKEISINKHKNVMVWFSCLKKHLFKVWNIECFLVCHVVQVQKGHILREEHIQLRFFSHLFDHEGILIFLSN